MPRRKGSLGKPKVIAVKLSDLNRVFSPESKILVDRRYATALAAQQVEMFDGQEFMNSEKMIDQGAVGDTLSLTVLDYSK